MSHIKKKKKVCLISSSGGHYEQLLMLNKLENNYDVYIITEKTKYNKKKEGISYLTQVNREEKMFIVKFFMVFIQSLYLFFTIKPDIIISTGALACIPMLLIGKVFSKKVIFIESFAKTNSPTKTGKLMYKYADVFIIQWESLKTVYPRAIYLGSVY